MTNQARHLSEANAVVGWLLVGYWLVIGWLLVGYWLVVSCWLLVVRAKQLATISEQKISPL